MKNKEGLIYYLLPNPLAEEEAVAWDNYTMENLLEEYQPPVKRILYTPQNRDDLQGKVNQLEEKLRRRCKKEAQRLRGLGFIWLGGGLGITFLLGRFLFKYGYGGLTELFANIPFISKTLFGASMVGGVLGGLVLALLPLGIAVAKVISYWGRANRLSKRANSLAQLGHSPIAIETSPQLALFWQQASPLTHSLREKTSQLKQAKGEREEICLEIEQDLHRLFRLSRLHQLDEVAAGYYHQLHAFFYNLRKGSIKSYEVLQ